MLSLQPGRNAIRFRVPGVQLYSRDHGRAEQRADRKDQNKKHPLTRLPKLLWTAELFHPRVFEKGLHILLEHIEGPEGRIVGQRVIEADNLRSSDFLC